MCLLSLSIQSHGFANLFKVSIYIISVNDTALVPKDAFAQRFASIQAILDPLDFLKNYELILT